MTEAALSALSCPLTSGRLFRYVSKVRGEGGKWLGGKGGKWLGSLGVYWLSWFQEKNNTRETEVAKMEKLVSFVKEPLLEKEAQTMAAM